MTASKTMEKDNKEALSLKEAGNQCYKEDDSSGALENYTKAIEICEETNDEKLMATCLKNRAAVFLKDEDYESVISDCTRALEIVPNDPKTLFRYTYWKHFFNFFLQKKSWKNSSNFVYIQATQRRTPFILTKFFTENSIISKYYFLTGGVKHMSL